jgi:hyperosmotically inducible periplasmic protein
MKILHTLKFIGISMLVVVGLAACDQPGPAETAGKNIDQTFDEADDKISDTADSVGDTISEQSNKAGVAINDTTITARVKAAIFAEPVLSTLQISVDTVNGVVSLSGSVDSRAQSDLAKSLASGVSGVSKVNNQLAIKSD